jgi:hypothetical protein
LKYNILNKLKEAIISKPKVAIVKTGGLKGNSEFLGSKFVRYDEDIAQLKEKIAETIALSVGSINSIIKEDETDVVGLAVFLASA